MANAMLKQHLHYASHLTKQFYLTNAKALNHHKLEGLDTTPAPKHTCTKARLTKRALHQGLLEGKTTSTSTSTKQVLL